MEFVRYTLIGGVATCVHYIVLLILVSGLNLTPPLAAASGAACGALVAYTGNRRFTFISRSCHRTALLRFLFVAAVGAALNGGVVWAATATLAWHYLAAQVAATLLILIATFTINRLWTFA